MKRGYKIQKNVPIPHHRGGKSKYPFLKMDIGDSFVVEDNTRDAAKIASGIRNSYHNVYRYNLEFKSAKFTIRVIDKHSVRCWRIK